MNFSKYYDSLNKTNEQYLKKVKLTAENVAESDDLQVMSDCLILKSRLYKIGEFQGRSDFKFVYSADLQRISTELFKECANLKKVVLLN